MKLPGRDERDRGPGRPNRPAQAPPKAAPKDRQRSPGQTALSTQGCATVADNPGQSGPSLKLSRRSDGCQRFERVSRMSPKVHVVQSLNFSRLHHGTQATMPAQQPLRTANSPRAAWSLWRGGVVIGLLAAGCFALGLGDVPFVDEYAYITQSYQPDLVFAGRMNDVSWLDGLGYDLVPLPKFWINLAFRAAGIPRPSPWNAARLVRQHILSMGDRARAAHRAAALDRSGGSRLRGDLCHWHDPS